MMHSGLDEGVVAVERERARVTKIISDKVMIGIFFMMMMTRRMIREMVEEVWVKMPI